jgi:hypothetical protein
MGLSSTSHAIGDKADVKIKEDAVDFGSDEGCCGKTRYQAAPTTATFSGFTHTHARTCNIKP